MTLGIGAATEPPLSGTSFVLDGQPVPWGRARLNGSRHFMAPKVRQYHTAIQHAANIAFRGHIYAISGLVVTVEAVLTVPPSWTKAKRNRALQGLQRPTGRPDVDNYAKIVLDALNGIAWTDDAQVVELKARKRYGEYPYLKVEVRPA